MNNKPTISIITVNRNNADGLRKTMSSVWERQNCDAFFFEHIIIDGASTDASVKVIEEYKDRLSYWVSEPDKGIYSAMNKGIMAARGEYLIFMNSGDYFVDNILSDRLFEKGREDIVYCDMFLPFENGTKNLKMPKNITFAYMFTSTLSHQASLIKRALFEKTLYNESWVIASDWEFFIVKILIEKCSTRYLPISLSYFDTTGFSSNKDNDEVHQLERRQVLERICREHSELFVSYTEDLVLDMKKVKYMFKSRTEHVLSSHRTQKMIRKWVKPLLLFSK